MLWLALIEISAPVSEGGDFIDSFYEKNENFSSSLAFANGTKFPS